MITNFYVEIYVCELLFVKTFPQRDPFPRETKHYHDKERQRHFQDGDGKKENSEQL